MATDLLKAPTSPQLSKTAGVYHPAASGKHLNCRRYAGVCVPGAGRTGVLYVISGVLNDWCSMCNWVALPEISVALTPKLGSILGRPERRSQNREQGSKCPRLLSQLFSNVKLT